MLSRGIARPIEALGRATRAVAGGRGRVPDALPTAAVEIQDLYRDFAAMAESIRRRSRYLRDFAHAVSHEFKTPLAGIRSALKLLGDHGQEMTPAERARFLANAGGDADRLTLLVSRLLDLARADIAEPDEWQAVEIGPILACVIDAHRSDLFSISLDPPPSMPRLAVPAATLDTVLGTSRLGLPIVRSLLDAAGGIVTLDRSENGTAFVLRVPVSVEPAGTTRQLQPGESGRQGPPRRSPAPRTSSAAGGEVSADRKGDFGAVRTDRASPSRYRQRVEELLTGEDDCFASQPERSFP